MITGFHFKKIDLAFSCKIVGKKVVIPNCALVITGVILLSEGRSGYIAIKIVDPDGFIFKISSYSYK